MIADALSRIPWPVEVVGAPDIAALAYEARMDEELCLPAVENEEDLIHVPPKLDMKTIELAQVNDENISRVIVSKQTNTPFDLEMELNITPFLRTLIQLYDQLELHGSVLVLRERDPGAQCRVVVPTELIDSILTATHSTDPATHEGAAKVLARLLPYYY